MAVRVGNTDRQRASGPAQRRLKRVVNGICDILRKDVSQTLAWAEGVYVGRLLVRTGSQKVDVRRIIRRHHRAIAEGKRDGSNRCTAALAVQVGDWLFGPNGLYAAATGVNWFSRS